MYIVWFDKIKPRIKLTLLASTVTIAAHPIDYAFVTDKAHKKILTHSG